MVFPLLGVITAIFPLLDKIIPDVDERMRVQSELTMAAMDKESSFTESMSAQIVEELKQTSWYVKGWRPTISWMLILMNVWNWVLRPVASVSFGVDIEGIPADVLLTMTGLWTSVYGIGRTIEKTGSSFKIGK